MGYRTAGEMAARWGVTARQVQRLLKAGRVAGAQLYGGSWMIPADAPRPADLRRREPLRAASPWVYQAYTRWPCENPDAAIDAMEPAYRALVAAELCYWRGDYLPAKQCYHALPPDSPGKLSAAGLAVASAISTGDYALYDEIRVLLTGYRASASGQGGCLLLDLPETLAAVSIAAPGLTPEWLKQGDFSAFPQALSAFLTYLYTLHLRNIGDFSAVLAASSTAMAFCPTRPTFTWIDVYNRILYAEAACALGDTALAEKALEKAMKLALPHGLIAPFAEHLTAFGGLMEACLERYAPARLKDVVGLWKKCFRNWLVFHNHFTRERITTLLTPQEYHVARLLAQGYTYAQAAGKLHLSISRINELASGVYGKLFIKKKAELRPLLL